MRVQVPPSVQKGTNQNFLILSLFYFHYGQTEYEEGHLYEDEDLHKFFDIDDDSYPEWDFNGSSYNWSGIGNEDNYETSRKKWDDYKSQFPKVTSKDQFRID